jgi:hypothetical protein
MRIMGLEPSGWISLIVIVGFCVAIVWATREDERG